MFLPKFAAFQKTAAYCNGQSTFWTLKPSKLEFHLLIPCYNCAHKFSLIRIRTQVHAFSGMEHVRYMFQICALEMHSKRLQHI